MRGEATVLHADLDAFYASVEQRDAPELRGRPVIVGGGVVLAASYEAKARGVRTAMGGRQARDLCPEAVVVPPRMDAYSAASKDVFAIFRDTTPIVEGLSIDEAFLEVGGLRRIAGTPEQIATRLRERVRAEVGLAISVGIARTKFLAKVASAVSKPDGLILVEPDREQEFLLPLPVERLWGVGAVTAEKLHRLGIRTVGQLAELEEATAERLLGRAAGAHLHALARLRDPRPVNATKRRGSIGSQRALGSRPRTPEELDLILTQIVDRLARRLRDGDRTCRTIVLRLRFGDFARATRSRTLGCPSDRTSVLLTVARSLLAAVQPEIAARGISLIGISLSHLGRSDTFQPELPIDWDDSARLDTVLDAVRDRFGATSVARAAQLGRDPGWSTPLLPEHL
ncbi:DNA polymerase-4 [Leifsonia sp. 98AMF]|uniref:DNA polymerase IV n=1 Tax=unclassified Leifsonia TaxID=2663824 RepID=UPI00087D9A70|nr:MULTISPECIES: DNA polymerase IV [unclassified Leifsonia]SDH51514.1 DNA polymerase-4 [Leifsonia sp. 197AMF]SDI86725.1 DNA polymerase-4 [Leifsonia sp. 466MF]SDJ95276.1 DNA polymerase-4 [Leifsonia sp. 157MF]SDN90146.1 DNA polymerase-4 [Leifsonia sp. 509MF]SEN15836.1 DNA polymerase-4 [Leifsonia sp. 467MF]